MYKCPLTNWGWSPKQKVERGKIFWSQKVKEKIWIFFKTIHISFILRMMRLIYTQYRCTLTIYSTQDEYHVIKLINFFII